MKKLFPIVAVGVASISIVLLFQNCGSNFRAQSGSASSSSASTAAVSAADLNWSTKQIVPAVSDFQKAQRWEDTKSSVFIYPYWNADSRQLDMSSAPQLVTETTQPFLRFTDSTGLAPLIEGATDFSTQNATLILVVQRLRFLTNEDGSTASLRLFDFSDRTGLRSGSLVLDAKLNANGDVELQAMEYFDESNSVSHSLIINSADLAKPLAIAVRFESDQSVNGAIASENQVQISVNGNLGSNSQVIAGTGLKNLILSSRYLMIHGFAGWGGAGGGFDLGQITFFKRALGNPDLQNITAALARDWGVQVNSTPVPIATATPQTTLPGVALINSNCLGCHGTTFDGVKTALRGKTAAQITTMLSSIPQMQGISLTASQISDIAAALQ